MKSYSIFIICILLTGMLACRKDKPTPCDNDPECFNYDLPPLSYFASGRFQYQSPYFNPNNANEFVYNYFDYELKDFHLMKHNLLTGESVQLTTDVKIISQPKWSRKGWIAFDNVYGASNYQISIIKDNGDSLKQFTSAKANLFPTWDATGDHLYWQYSPVLGIPYYFIKQGLSSLDTDTVMRDGDVNSGYATLNDVSIDNILLSKSSIQNKIHVGITSLSNISFNSILELEKNKLIGINGLCWSNNSQTAYFTIYGGENRGLYQLDIKSKTYVKLISFCDSKRYKNISCSPDGQKLIGERTDSYLEKYSDGNLSGKVIENSSIYIIDLKTLKETKINLD